MDKSAAFILGFQAGFDGDGELGLEKVAELLEMLETYPEASELEKQAMLSRLRSLLARLTAPAQVGKNLTKVEQAVSNYRPKILPRGQTPSVMRKIIGPGVPSRPGEGLRSRMMGGGRTTDL